MNFNENFKQWFFHLLHVTDQDLIWWVVFIPSQYQFLYLQAGFKKKTTDWSTDHSKVLCWEIMNCNIELENRRIEGESDTSSIPFAIMLSHLHFSLDFYDIYIRGLDQQYFARVWKPWRINHFYGSYGPWTCVKQNTMSKTLLCQAYYSVKNIIVSSILQCQKHYCVK